MSKVLNTSNAVAVGAYNDVEYVRPLAGVKTIYNWCEAIGIQDRQVEDSNAVTIVAVDPDVVSMFAFPLEKFVSGSVFHAWGPLREFGKQVSVALKTKNATEFLKLIEEAMQTPRLRAPLITTIALGQYIFHESVLGDAKEILTILPPHEVEWDSANRYAAGLAKTQSQSIPKVVSVEDILMLIRGQSPEQATQTLIEKIPSLVGLLFAPELRADYGLSALRRIAFTGRVKRYKTLVGSLPDFDELFNNEENINLLKSYELAISDDAIGATRTNEDNNRRDAKVLAWLQAVNKNGDSRYQMPDGTSRPVRFVLLTASARIQRVLRKEAGERFAQQHLRNPLAYLGRGKFFEWAFRNSDLTETDASAGDDSSDLAVIVERLKRSQFTQWLAPLISTKNDEGVSEQHMQAVRNWERLVDHMGTSLNIGFRRGNLLRDRIFKALKESGNQEENPVVRFATQLQSEVMETSLKFSQSISSFALNLANTARPIGRNVLPIRFDNFHAPQKLYIDILGGDLSSPVNRMAMVERVMQVTIQFDDKNALQSHTLRYVRSLLMCAMWSRIGDWSAAFGVVAEAATYAGEQATSGDNSLNGSEAIYLVAVLSRIQAEHSRDLELSRLALDSADEIAPKDVKDLRLEAEKASLHNADILLGNDNASAPNMRGIRLQILLNNFEAMPWLALRNCFKTTPSKPVDPSIGCVLYEDSFVLQQMYCQIMLSYLLYWQVARDLKKDDKEKVEKLYSEFKNFSDSLTSSQKTDSYLVHDSSTARILREAVKAVLTKDKTQLTKELGLIKNAFELSALDKKRNDWIVKYVVSNN
jgi:hypothetical protein